ncbi:LAMI_0B03774g1_1 [Lachancea mirantina]|uniref:LAMI_0B03774g1_1 n=1 Tax=Lachancea mirantina TaxID=1230905 RepID=A0A1G4IUT6_9SACH|nr:LAMI_0B03774g1_1 [Lachancea mirantina]
MEITATKSESGRVISYDADARRQRTFGSREQRLVNIITIVAAGFALISDGYQNNVMSMLNKVFPIEYGKEVYSSTVSTRVSNASLVGTILGQVFVGIACDYMGRKWSILVATLLLVIGTLLCAASHGRTLNGMFWMMTVMRGVTGFGIGAEYPCCSVSANEAANEHSAKRRGGIMVLVTNLPLSLGGPFANIVFLIVYSICGRNHLEAVWRTLFALGCFWPLSVFYFRWKMTTNTLYKKGTFKSTVPYWLVIKYCWKDLLGTCGTWFLYDFVTFPNGIFSSQIISSVMKDSNDLKKVAGWNLLLGIIAVPGCFVGAYLCDRIGRKYTLIFGFSGYLIFGLIIGCAFEQLSRITPLFIIFYGFMNGMANAGPGDMMGVVSSESFPTAVRGTCYGLSAALGKVGAVVGTQCFTPIRDNLGKRWTFIIAALCGLAGIIVSTFLIRHLREDDLMRQDIDFHNFLIEHGWEGRMGFDESDSDDAVPSQSSENLHSTKKSDVEVLAREISNI